MSISKGSSLRLPMVPSGYDGHMFVRIGLSSSSLEETIASSSNMIITHLTVLPLVFCYIFEKLLMMMNVGFRHLFLNRQWYLFATLCFSAQQLDLTSHERQNLDLQHERKWVGGRTLVIFTPAPSSFCLFHLHAVTLSHHINSFL